MKQQFSKTQLRLTFIAVVLILIGTAFLLMRGCSPDKIHITVTESLNKLPSG